MKVNTLLCSNKRKTKSDSVETTDIQCNLQERLFRFENEQSTTQKCIQLHTTCTKHLNEFVIATFVSSSSLELVFFLSGKKGGKPANKPMS